MRAVAGSPVGRRCGGPPRLVLALVLAVATTTLGTALADAQTVLPEQRLSTTLSNVYFDPQLRASGTRVFGAWGGADVRPTNISYGYSVDRGETWVNEAALPLLLSGGAASMPMALGMDGTGGIQLMVLTSTHYYFRRDAVATPLWAAPVWAVAPDGYMDDVQSIAAAPGAQSVFFAYTHRLDNFDYRMRFIRSMDSGATWSAPVELSSAACNGSSMVMGPDGTLYVTWVDYALGQILLRRSSDQGATFSPPVAVAGMFDNLNATPLGWQDPPGTYESRRYPYYREGVHYHAAPNFPALAVDRSDGPTRGTLYLVWADHAGGSPAPATTTYADAESNDSAGAAQLVTLDSDIDGYLWNSGHTGPVDHDWYAFDGQQGETIVLDGSTSGYYSDYCSLYEELPGGSRLYVGSARLLGDLDLSTGSHPRPPVITLPRTGRYLLQLVGSVVQVSSYRVRLRRYVVDPASVARDMRDIVLVRSSDGGQTWSPRVRVNGDPAGTDQHQPNVAVDERGRVYVAWYDRRDSEFGDEVVPYASVSSDGGATFGPDLRLTQAASNWVGPNIVGSSTYPGQLVGDRIAIAAGDDFGMVAWPDAREVDVLTLGMSVYGARIVDVPTAVAAVSDLAAEPDGGTVRLRWRVNDASGLRALDILRAESGGPERAIGSAALTGAAGEAEYVDAAVEPGRTYGYRLRVSSGSTSYHLGPVAVTTPARIEALAWRAAGPNPFAQRATVTLAVPRAEAARVRVYDVQGKVVRTLHEGLLEAGEQRLEWDGRDAAGADAAPGLYFVAAQAGGEAVRTKLTRVR